MSSSPVPIHRASTYVTSRFDPEFNAQRDGSSHACNPPIPGVDTLSILGRIPRISTFSGASSKADVSFETWKFEVKCIMREKACHKDFLLQGVRKSLRGEACKLCMHLEEDASVETIVRKLEGVYGIVESGTTLLQQFYNAREENDESVAAYGCRLEEIVNRAINRGAVAKEQADEMLRSKLWTGLKDERIRNATRYKYEIIPDFDTLRAELRAMEQEIRELDSVREKAPKPPRAVLPATFMPQTKGDSDHDSTRKSVAQLTAKVKELEEKVAKQPDTTKMLSKILEKIEKLEEKSKEVGREGVVETKPLNSRGPLPRDSQKVHQSRQKFVPSYAKLVKPLNDMVTRMLKSGNSDTVVCLRISFEGMTALLNDPEVRDKLKKKVVEEVVQLGFNYLTDRPGSVVFVLETTNLTALKELWKKCRDDSLRNDLNIAISESQEMEEKFEGVDIDFIVDIDEEEFREACWELHLFSQNEVIRKNVTDSDEPLTLDKVVNTVELQVQDLQKMRKDMSGMKDVQGYLTQPSLPSLSVVSPLQSMEKPKRHFREESSELEDFEMRMLCKD
ncbi:hypothetical protein QZH41_017450 [Actinostola sp. cb2023]|nr:hypothetical protein QZH41_017450 [Actinostola sp. cb2023]